MEIDTSVWTGRTSLFKDGVKLERSSEKGKPFLAESDAGELIKIYPKATLTELTPALEIDGIKYCTQTKLPWHQSVVALLPMLLIFVGGGLGGGIGAVATMLNVKTFRGSESPITKYFKVIGISALSYVLYSLVAYLLIKMIER
ncbi:hypothetical protein M472_00450 [Sphingobacterium paucimobilis HER1398]|uniref:Uncharacterized protein n=2 Tax=Sphingobacterium TaxID=28453 RepID=U2HPL0_9SPHI|nr:hypothetical protein M472_00450 [Sphingobacterium paucimobilis HER1398]